MVQYQLFVMLGLIVIIRSHDHHSNPDLDPDDPGSVEKVLQDTEHMKEHYGGKMDKVDWTKMTNNERLFHFFKINDHDENNKLDGLELWKGYNHWMGDFSKPKTSLQGEEREAFYEKLANNRFKSIQRIVDNFLDEDQNDDGYLTFAEYVRAQEVMRSNYKAKTTYGDRSDPYNDHNPNTNVKRNV
ncbi:unnamed protein product [Owenia fusiformis]|uniref:Uncharacterized protein n=1 Tax=Owenia fusiformis TaxID=6347 RepID=A0A8S4PFU5_OWEFU|nr:unnamed protein product [Owenia fusiformis]